MLSYSLLNVLSVLANGAETSLLLIVFSLLLICGCRCYHRPDLTSRVPVCRYRGCSVGPVTRISRSVACARLCSTREKTAVTATTRSVPPNIGRRPSGSHSDDN